MTVFVLIAHWDGEDSVSVVGVFSSDAAARAYVTEKGRVAGLKDFVSMHREAVDDPFRFGDEEAEIIWRRPLGY